MPLTPAEVRHVLFSTAPVGTRGYSEDEVDSFLDRVHVELARLIEENNDLRNQREQRDQQLPAGPVDTGGSSGRPSAELVMRPMQSPDTGQSSPGADHGLQTALVLAWAQERADQVTEAANAEVEKMLNQARVYGAQLLSEAQVKAEDMVNEARIRVESMLGDARTTAQTVERQSRDKATSLAQHATCTHAEILKLNQDKSLLENAIFDLQAFEQERRTQVAIYLQSLLDELDGSGSAASADPLCTQQDVVGCGLGAPGETGQSPPSEMSRIRWKPLGKDSLDHQLQG